MKKIVIVSSCSMAGYAEWRTHKPIYDLTFTHWLQKYLGDEYDVRQFNSGGASMAKNTLDPIWNDDGYKGKNPEIFKGVYVQQYESTFNNVFREEVEAGKYKFEDAEFIFVGAWGTNDADWRNVDIAKHTFAADYNEFLDYFKNVSKKYIVQLPPTFGGYLMPDGSEQSGFDMEAIQSQMPLVNGIFIDVDQSIFVQSDTNDNVHFVQSGAKKYARIIADGMLGITPQPPANDYELYKEACDYDPYWEEREDKINFSTLDAFWKYLVNKISLNEWSNLTAEAQFNMYLVWSGQEPEIPEPPVNPPAIIDIESRLKQLEKISVEVEKYGRWVKIEVDKIRNQLNGE